MDYRKIDNLKYRFIHSERLRIDVYTILDCCDWKEKREELELWDKVHKAMCDLASHYEQRHGLNIFKH